MEDIIYDDWQGNLMTESDLWSWVVCSKYEGLTFDEITGGEEEFINDEVYFRLKKQFEHYSKMKRIKDDTRNNIQ